MTPHQPLATLSIVVTRPRRQSSSLSRALGERGARVIEAPAIHIEPPKDFGPLDAALGRLGDYDWIIFTSVNGVEAFFERLLEKRTDSQLENLRFAAIGPATARALRARGFEAELVPERFVAEEVYRALESSTPLAGRRFLLPRADIARPALPRLLEEAGARVDVVTAYRTVPATDALHRVASLLRRGSVDIVTFTSGSTVRSFFQSVDPRSVAGKFLAASIGPITSEALREEGIEPTIEASEYTADGLVEAIVRYVVRRGGAATKASPPR